MPSKTYALSHTPVASRMLASRNCTNTRSALQAGSVADLPARWITAVLARIARDRHGPRSATARRTRPSHARRATAGRERREPGLGITASSSMEGWRRVQADPFVETHLPRRAVGRCEIAVELDAVAKIRGVRQKGMGCRYHLLPRAAACLRSGPICPVPACWWRHPSTPLRKCAAANGQPSSSTPIRSDPGGSRPSSHRSRSRWPDQRPDQRRLLQRKRQLDPGEIFVPDMRSA